MKGGTDRVNLDYGEIGILNILCKCTELKTVIGNVVYWSPVSFAEYYKFPKVKDLHVSHSDVCDRLLASLETVYSKVTSIYIYFEPTDLLVIDECIVELAGKKNIDLLLCKKKTNLDRHCALLGDVILKISQGQTRLLGDL